MQGLDCTQQPPLCNGFHVDLHNVHMDLQNGPLDKSAWQLPKLGLVDPSNSLPCKETKKEAEKAT
jgi:hypothetical protein